ncbi:MAG: hypothetical protein Q8R16_02960 [bacterium]|nr:hypothetical protein [bacterium]
MHRRNARNECGASLIGVMGTIGIVMLVVGVGFYGILAKVLVMGNQWVTREGALECVQLVEPKAKKIVKLERHAWSPSVVTVEDAEGKRSVYDLDADVLFNADCIRAPGSD